MEMITDELFDACVQTPQLRALKAAIPHMDTRQRHALSIAVKLMEIQRLHRHYDQLQIQEQSRPTMQSASTTKDNRHDILRAIQPHLPPEQQQQLDLLMTFMQAQSLYTTMNPEKEDIII